MGDPVVYGSPARLARVMDEHARLLHEYEVAGGLTYENRVRSTLRDLGLGDETFDRTLATLSGGQAKLVGLARLLVWQPDLLLLDEPDNHLDVAGKEAVERLVRGYDGAVVIVSHDRYLLDQVVDRIAELEARSDHGLARHLLGLSRSTSSWRRCVRSSFTRRSRSASTRSRRPSRGSSCGPAWWSMNATRARPAPLQDAGADGQSRAAGRAAAHATGSRRLARQQ